jgi:hypothetical protein
MDFFGEYYRKSLTVHRTKHWFYAKVQCIYKGGGSLTEHASSEELCDLALHMLRLNWLEQSCFEPFKY